MRTSDFEYDLPPELIAQVPESERDASRMLVVDREARRLDDRRFRELPSLLRPGDLLVVNVTRVIPARLRGVREKTGGKVEVLLIEPVAGVGGGKGGEDTWLVWTRSGGKLLEGEWLKLAGGALRARIAQRRGEDGDVVEFSPAGEWLRVVDDSGQMPLPPYIRRDAGSDDPELGALDRERYQTVYADEPGAVAAPTAGLHFTPRVMEEISAAGVRIERLVLHVGPGTFRPVKAESPDDHHMHPERYSIPPRTADAVAGTKEAGGRVVAVGTTVTRALEAAALPGGGVRPGDSATDLFIRPGFEFSVVDALLTNFHLPRSTLLMLVAALAGRDTILDAYRHAVTERYRFYSYGDCMLIV